jgi:hypothetical protein
LPKEDMSIHSSSPRKLASLQHSCLHFQLKNFWFPREKPSTTSKLNLSLSEDKTSINYFPMLQNINFKWTIFKFHKSRITWMHDN